MPLPIKVAALDTVPEAFRGEYTERDGEFHLNVEGLEDVGGLKSALHKERTSRGTLEKQMNAWKNLGKTPEEIQELLEAQAKKDEENARKSGDFDSILKQHQEKSAKEKADLEAELNAARASERSAIIGTSVLGELTKHGATEEGAELLPDRLSNRIKFETVNGKRVLKIMQADGETPMAGSGADGTATIADLVKEAKEKYPSLFKGKGGGGGGKEPDAKENPGGSGVTKKSDFKSEKERAAWVNKFGLPAYEALPA